MPPHSMKTAKIKSILSTIIAGAIAVPIISIGAFEGAELVGLRPVPVPVVGTGSMYPSLFWEKSEGGPEDPENTTLHEYRTDPLMYRYIPKLTVLGKTIELSTIEIGDMVAFQNSKTRGILENEGRPQEAGFIKRVIAKSGDRVELRDGFLIRNGESVEEPYVNKPRSTYGGVSIPDCTQITVPDDHVLVMGDNRKLSTDSRHELGLVSLSDITFTLPLEKQDIYKELWRDTSKDEDLANKPTLDTSEFYRLVDEEREKSGAPNLTPKSALSRSAGLRGNVMIKTNDFSTQATVSGYTMQDALRDVGYSNILTGEFVSHGYYSADELINNLTYFRETKSQITKRDYQDIGVAVVNGEINSCPTQVIVGHLAGYVPAEYEAETIESWGTLLNNLNEVIPSWEKAREYEELDQEKLSRLLDILYKRRSLAQDVYNTMVEKRWLTDSQKQEIERDKEWADEANQLTQELNSQ